MGGIDILDYAFENVPSGQALIDANGIILRVNAAAAAIVGRTSDELVGRPFVDFVHPDDLADAMEQLERTLGGDGESADLRAQRPDGTWIWLRGKGTVLPTPEPITFAVFEDVTVEREVADRLERADAELRIEQAEAVRRGQVLSAFAGLAVGSDDLKELIEGLAALAIEHLAPLAGVVLLDEEHKLRVATVDHIDPEVGEALREMLRTKGALDVEGQLEPAIEEGKLVAADEGPLHPELTGTADPFADRYPMGARLVVPMSAPEGSVGALVLIRHVGDPPFSDADRDLATVMAARAALAVRNARLEERRQEAERATARRAAQQSAVAQLGRAAIAGAGVSELAEQATELVADTLEVPYCAVLFDDEHPDGLLLAASTGRFADYVGIYRRRRDDAVTTTLGGHEPTLVHDLAAEVTTGARQLLVDQGVRSLAAVPIVPRSAHAGLLVAGGSVPHAFTPQDTTFLETMANVLASALDARRALEDLRHNALHDSLTGLPNRALVLDRLQLALGQASRSGSQVAVLICDVDRFKVVNDGLGHAAGDEVLGLVGERLGALVRPGDTVGRFGGDEFVVVCPEIPDVASVVEIAERLAGALREPMHVLGTSIVVTASIGIALGQGTGPEPAAGLLRDADAAMYRAKARGRARYELFDDDMRARASERLLIESELRRAISEDELVLHYQPVLAVRTGEVVGVEALVRWAHPRRGLVPPLEFLPVAGECGLLPDLGAWAFAEAARQTASWVAAGHWGERWTSVNLAPQQLGDPTLIGRIDGIIADSGADASLLRVELTEDSLVEDTLEIGAVLGALRARGLCISVDDFGTGYSSLAYLKRLPVDVLKLDRGFVAGLGDDGDDAVISAAVIGMAQALGLTVVAEGVENQLQLDALRVMGCDMAQGFFFAKPLPAAELESWLAHR